MHLKAIRALAAAAALAGLGAAPGCASTCEDIERHRAEFEARERASPGPDARLMIPFSFMDRVIAGRLTARPPLPIALPTERLGMPFALSLTLDRVTTHAARADRLGMSVTLGLADGGTRIVELELDTEVAPRLEMGSAPGRPPAIALALRAQDLGAVRPRVTPAGTTALARWLREHVPGFARALVSDEVAQAVARESLDFIAEEVWPRAKDKLLGKAPLVDTRLELPDLPIRELALSSVDTALVALMTTDLPDARPVAKALDKAEGRMVLRLAGGTAMGLVNRAMARGEVPARFDSEGKPKADGVWEARLGWQGGSSPLVVNLWRTTGSCKRAAVGARLGLALRGDKVGVQVYEGRFLSVAGPAFAEALAWLDNLFGSAMAFTFETAALMRFESGRDTVQLRLARVILGADDLLVDLDLGISSK